MPASRPDSVASTTIAVSQSSHDGEERDGLALALDEAHAGRQRPVQQARHLESHRVIAAERVPDSDDADRHSRSTSSVRKCVAHEMHGS